MSVAEERLRASELNRDTPNGRARDQALQGLGGMQPAATELVTYTSRGRLLIVGPQDEALPLARRLGAAPGGLHCTVLAGAGTGTEREAAGDGVEVIPGRPSRLSGHLGRFAVALSVPDGEMDLAELAGVPGGHFDLVLDLGVPAQLQRQVPPPGYFAPEGDPARLEEALAELPGLVGELDKPRFFEYDPSICAHGRSGIQGCSRCIDACPTEAIVSRGERIEVDPFLCQGAGSCATACPSGAIRYGFPRPGALLDTLRGLLRAYREGGGEQACVLFHDSALGAGLVARDAEDLPGRVLPVAVEEVGSVGAEVWLSMLAYGAREVRVLSPEGTPPGVAQELAHQLRVVRELLAGMGWEADRVAMIDEAQMPGALQAPVAAGGQEPEAAGFAAFDDKRTMLRLALDHLWSQAPAPRPSVDLGAGAPFGEVAVDAARCTLCMACVAVCPAGALLAGSERPQLRFVEDHCVQCGLCERACPERCVGLSPRYLYDAGQRRQVRVLHEEEVFCCEGCGKPFASRRMIERTLDRLQGHWMFQTPESRRRLRMCEDCRVRDAFAAGSGGPLDGS